MNGSTSTAFHPRWLRRRVSTWWWLSRRSYLAFILRELSSVFVAWVIGYLLLVIQAVGAGPEAWQQFLTWSGRPMVLVLNGVSLAFIVFHAVTWFNLAPQAMVVHVAGRRLPGSVIAGGNFAAWAAVSALLVWLLAGGR
jgi:fumarate reductase subunit C